MDAPPPVISPLPSTLPASPKRHGCLTAWLIIMLVLFGFLGLGNLAGLVFQKAINDVAASKGVEPSSFSATLCYFVFSTLICASIIALLLRKKLGLYATLASLAALGISGIVLKQTFGDAFFALIMALGLLGLLQIGKPENGWKQLK